MERRPYRAMFLAAGVVLALLGANNQVSAQNGGEWEYLVDQGEPVQATAEIIDFKKFYNGDQSRQKHAFILDPIPEPFTLAAFGLATSGLLLRRRRTS